MTIFYKFFILIFAFTLSFVHAQDGVVERISVPGPIEFNGTEFFLSWSKQNSKTLTVQEFLPKDEKIEDFEQLLNFSYFNRDIEPEDAVRAKVESVQKIMEKDKFASVNVTESPDGKEFIVDYTLSVSEGENNYLEYNIYRFKKYPEKENKPLLVLSYAKRIYGDLKPSMKALSRQRNTLMKMMIDYKIPPITVINQYK
ncbi:MAG: hypothetical protein QM564_09550 [Bergeyella sp.]